MFRRSSTALESCNGPHPEGVGAARERPHRAGVVDGAHRLWVGAAPARPRQSAYVLRRAGGLGESAPGSRAPPRRTAAGLAAPRLVVAATRIGTPGPPHVPGGPGHLRHPGGVCVGNAGARAFHRAAGCAAHDVLAPGLDLCRPHPALRSLHVLEHWLARGVCPRPSAGPQTRLGTVWGAAGGLCMHALDHRADRHGDRSVQRDAGGVGTPKETTDEAGAPALCPFLRSKLRLRRAGRLVVVDAQPIVLVCGRRLSRRRGVVRTRHAAHARPLSDISQRAEHAGALACAGVRGHRWRRRVAARSRRPLVGAGVGGGDVVYVGGALLLAGAEGSLALGPLHHPLACALSGAGGVGLGVAGRPVRGQIWSARTVRGHGGAGLRHVDALPPGLVVAVEEAGEPAPGKGVSGLGEGTSGQRNGAGRRCGLAAFAREDEAGSAGAVRLLLLQDRPLAGLQTGEPRALRG